MKSGIFIKPSLFERLLRLLCPRVTTIVLVRHGERGSLSSDPDPPLTTTGQQRAQALVEVANRAFLSAIYVTEFQRTSQTAQPIATALGVMPAQFNISSNPAQHALNVATDILTNHSGHAVLVVGHSDTVPLIIEALGVSSPPTIGSDEFNLLFIVIKARSGVTRLIRGRYGA